MILAIMFVPVLFYFFFGALVAPCCFAIFEILGGRGPRIMMEFYVVIYFAVFFAAGWWSYRLPMLSIRQTTQIRIQCFILLGLFACSFLRLIAEGEEAPGNAEMSGTYNFWEACVRLSHTYHRYFP
jgi:hypothetical protein